MFVSPKILRSIGEGEGVSNREWTQIDANGTILFKDDGQQDNF